MKRERTKAIVACSAWVCPQNKHTFFIFCPKIANEYDFKRFREICHRFRVEKYTAFKK